jgi:4-hydroxybenzoate polyprenyltransferase
MKWKALSKLLMIEQTIFSLPWSLSAISLAWPSSPEGAFNRLLWVILGIICARISGMSFNRWIDRKIDEKNPRTAQRPLQIGSIKLLEVQMISGASLLALILIATQLGRIYLLISPLIVVLLVGYSFTKRFTCCCHFFLGLIYAAAVLLSFSSLAQDITWASLLLCLCAGSFISASDIIYSLQDRDHDKAYNLYSLPVKIGSRAAINVSIFIYCVISLGILVFIKLANLNEWAWIGGIIYGFATVYNSYMLYQLKKRIIAFTAKRLIDVEVYALFFKITAFLPFIVLGTILLGQL